MSTLYEIEEAADLLSEAEKESLMRYLAIRLRKERAVPELRVYPEADIAAMLAEDEIAGERFRSLR